jgi:cysteinyl-tRNA synthetase
MDDAKTALSRIDEWRKLVKAASLEISQPDPTEESVQLEKFLDLVELPLANDLNINGVLGQLFQIIRTTNGALANKQITSAAVGALLKSWNIIDSILGLGDATVTVPAEVQALVDQRTAARQAKDFAKSDELRKAVEALGWKVKDTAKGQELSPG